LARLESKISKHACEAGNSAYCSPIDKVNHWLWHKIPSAISIHSGYSGQAGFGGEAGGFVEAEYVYNWRSLEVDRFLTSGTTF
jgi:hypothetical protein